MLSLDATLLQDPAVLGAAVAAVGSLGTGLGVGVKTLVDWSRRRAQDKNQQQVEVIRQKSTSEELVRDDLLLLFQLQGVEIVKLRAELAAARQEIRDFQALHQKAMVEWQEKYTLVYMELAEVKAYLKANGMTLPNRQTNP